MTERYISVTDDEYVYFLDTESEYYKTLEDFEKKEFENAKKDNIDVEEYEDAILQSASDKYWDYVYDYHMEADSVCDLLNEQDKTIKELNKYCTACDDTLITIQELTYKLLSIDFAGVKSKVDYCRLLNELDNKDLSFIHDCIEAINKCDLMKMEELKREYGDCE